MAVWEVHRTVWMLVMMGVWRVDESCHDAHRMIYLYTIRETSTQEDCVKTVRGAWYRYMYTKHSRRIVEDCLYTIRGAFCRMHYHSSSILWIHHCVQVDCVFTSLCSDGPLESRRTSCAYIRRGEPPRQEDPSHDTDRWQVNDTTDISQVKDTDTDTWQVNDTTDTPQTYHESRTLTHMSVVSLTCHVSVPQTYHKSRTHTHDKSTTHTHMIRQGDVWQMTSLRISQPHHWHMTTQEKEDLLEYRRTAHVYTSDGRGPFTSSNVAVWHVDDWCHDTARMMWCSPFNEHHPRIILSTHFEEDGVYSWLKEELVEWRSTSHL